MKPFTALFTPPVVTVRWAGQGDAATLSLIDSYSSHPWDAGDIRVALCGGAIGVVANVYGSVGFALYQEVPQGLELLRIVVAGAYRRRGIGRTLLARVASGLNPRMERLTCTVRESDLDSCRFLSACGWRALWVDRGAFSDPTEDGYRFAAIKEGGVPCPGR